MSNILNPNLSPEDKVTRGKVQLSRNYPFFGYLVEHMKIIQSDKVPTFGVTKKGKMYYNPKFADSLDKNDLLGVLAHEVMHLALEHPKRMGDRTMVLVGPDGQPFTLWNIAIDIVVNNMLVLNNVSLPDLEGGAIIPSNDSYTFLGYTVEDISNKNAEEIYDELRIHVEGTCDKQTQPGDSGVGSDGDEESSPNSSSNSNEDEGEPSYKVSENGKEFDQHLFNEEDDGKGFGDEEDDQDSENGNGDGDEINEGNKPDDVDWKRVFAEAMEISSKQKGSTPVGMEREYEVITTHKLNLGAYVRKQVGLYIPMDYSFRRPSKRFISQDIFMPSTYGEKIKIMFAIDTSGSISNDDLQKFISIIINVSKSHSLNIEFRLFTHDWSVHDDYHVYNGNINEIKKLKIHGGGGTSHIPLYDYIKAKKYAKDAKILFSFTDGFSDYPERKPKGFDTVFILTGSHCGKSNIPDWAKAVIEYHG